jgi:hypothetical protein
MQASHPGDRSVLVRAGATAPASQDKLLRPAHNTGYTDPNCLVRAAGNNAAAEEEQVDSTRGDSGNGKAPPGLWKFWRRAQGFAD